MTKAESAILEARDPEAYIAASLKARISPAAKAHLARLWMEKTGYTKEAILHARNRHPYWKKKKMEGSAERTRVRLDAHDYSSGGVVEWNAARIAKFLNLNGKDPSGRYEHRDWEIAATFSTSIPSIQYMRRKLRRAAEMLGPRATRERLVEYLGFAESVLVKGKQAVEGLKDTRAKAEKAAAPKKVAPKKVAPKKAAPKKAAPKKAAAKRTPTKKPVARRTPK